MIKLLFFLFVLSSPGILGMEAGVSSNFHREDNNPYFSKSLPAYKYETKWFEGQKVDHFAFANNATFKQKYLINDTWWDKNGGPIFFYTGNEGVIEAFAQNTGFMWDIAPEFNALLIFVEHRYYGESLPFGKSSTEKGKPQFNGYLSSEQALADYAYFITDFKKKNKNAAHSPVIVFGGSYGGMLSAWMRIKYPHIVDGAIAGSAPVAQFSAPCDAFGRIVTSDYTAQGKLCSSIIKKSWSAIDSLGKTDEGKKWITTTFKLCSPLKDTNSLKGYLSNVWTNAAMMDYPYPTNFLCPLPGYPVKAICKQMMNHKDVNSNPPKDEKQLLTDLFRGVSVYFNYTGTAKCLNVNDEDDIGAGMWDYQSCTEMVMPFCYDNVNDMFEKVPWNFTAYAESCESGWKVKPDQNMAEIMYGEKKLKAASNIVFSNGLLDPWSSGGIMRSISKSVVAIIIPEGAHHLDLRASNPADPQSVIHARKLERNYISKWIKQVNQESTSRYGPSSDNVVV